MNSSDNHQVPGYIAITFSKKDNMNDVANVPIETNLNIKEIAPDELPYQDFLIENAPKVAYAHKNRIGNARLLLRGEDNPLSVILDVGGIHPKYVKRDEISANPFSILNPFDHAISSKSSGCISCTHNMEAIKSYHTIRATYVYLVKAVGVFSGTNPREVEHEITVPGGVDAEDIIAVRKLFNGTFVPNEPLYININFIRRYPDLLDYILSRYSEKNEYCPGIKEIINQLPGAAKNNLKSDATLKEIQNTIIGYFEKYISTTPFPTHKERASAVITAIASAKSEDNIWYILNNQYDLFRNNHYSQGTISIPGLNAQFYSSKHVNTQNSDGYVALIEQALSVMPRVNPLNVAHAHADFFHHYSPYKPLPIEVSYLKDNAIYLLHITSDFENKPEKFSLKFNQNELNELLIAIRNNNFSKVQDMLETKGVPTFGEQKRIVNLLKNSDMQNIISHALVENKDKVESSMKNKKE